ncbi:restriction endonuclease [Flavobacterium rhamnosiphilum]|uniref:Restriction endonuclease n=1 Tax=Flavobacterium rhamnosiphilum TaxID=2541724 RepID=A0A4R5F753_9FLAO|nr:type II restriction endonuclease [Flavobacterium rhamnosiphilum]TDE43857.1 restriction endonuclease [Flavobacterium rhamnosiphilum]
MNIREKYITEFEKSLNKFVEELKKHVSTETGEWTVKGFIDIYKNIYTISSDTKIVSKILEIHIFPVILKFANDAGYKIILATHQNYYPDLTFVNKENDEIKFALDLKTTFRRDDKSAKFTLGSYGAYFKERDKSKNIQFPYNQYTGHYCLGVIYTRIDFDDDLSDIEIFQVNELEENYGNQIDPIGEREITKVENLKSITSVIKDFDFFAVAKWKIASDGKGSGNTANIGSVSNIDDLRAGNGVFSKLGEEWFDEYWINYGDAKIIRDNKAVPITNIWDFLEFKGRTDLIDKVGNGAKKRKSK